MLVSRTHWRIHGTPPYFKTKPRPGSPLSQGLDGRPPPAPPLSKARIRHYNWFNILVVVQSVCRKRSLPFS